jgi:hypothetical protein
MGDAGTRTVVLAPVLDHDALKQTSHYLKAGAERLFAITLDLVGSGTTEVGIPS